MEDSYFDAAQSSRLIRGIKILVVLRVFRVPNSEPWALFLSSNPEIKKWLRANYGNKYKDPVVVARRTDKLANLVSVALLYLATRNNVKIPKDYISLYLLEAYYGKLVPPSSPVIVSPTTATYFKLASYRPDGWVRAGYKHKHYLIFPLLCGQILSNYLTPTQHKLNQRYFSPLIKKWCLDPIWTHFQMDTRHQRVGWTGILSSYGKFNGIVFVYMALKNFRSRLLAGVVKNVTSSGRNRGSLKHALSEFLAYCTKRSNAVANMVYFPNLFSMLFISLTASSLTKSGVFREMYRANQKNAVKLYMRLIGFTAGALAMAAFKLKDRYFKGSEEDESTHLSSDFFNAINLYLAQMVVLSKWRILKENHPWFRLLRVGTWHRMETGLMCFLVWKIMNLNDYLAKREITQELDDLKELRNSPLVKAVNRIMV